MHEYASIHNFKQRVLGVRVGVQNFTITSLMIKLSRGSGPKYISEFSFQILSMRKLYLRQKSQNYQPSENHTFHTFFRNLFFNNGGLNRIGLTKDTADAHNYDANSFLSKR